MESLDLRKIRIELERRRRAVLARYLDEKAMAPELLDARDSEVVERGTTDWNAALLERISEDDRHRLELIDGARTRLDENRYGFCVVCGRPIERERLAALPETPHCLVHALSAAGASPQPIGEPW